MHKKILNYGINIVSALIFLLALYILIFGTLASKENKPLTIFGYSFSAVQTGSMEGNNIDSISQGAFIIGKNVPFEDIKLNDIILFQSDNKLIVHRVIRIEENKDLITKGDAAIVEDSFPVTAHNYQAKVIKSFEFFGLGQYIPHFQLLILFLLMVFLFILMIIQIIKILKIRHEDKMEKIKENYQEKL